MLFKSSFEHPLPDQRVDGDYCLVEPDGRLFIGGSYGRVKIAGMNLEEAKIAVEKDLSNRLRDPGASLRLVGHTKYNYAPLLSTPYHIGPGSILAKITLQNPFAKRNN